MLGSSRQRPLDSRRPRLLPRRTHRRGLIAFLGALCAALLATTLLSATASAGGRQAPADKPQTPAVTAKSTAAAGKTVGYFTNWGVYQRNYHVKNIETSGSADKLTHINYAFGNVQGGKCTVGDSYADYEKAYTAAQSVDGKADT
ncbi:glycosyl hydrolase family 18 protein, partial [Streptomyces smyrnaeus]